MHRVIIPRPLQHDRHLSVLGRPLFNFMLLNKVRRACVRVCVTMSIYERALICD